MAMMMPPRIGPSLVLPPRNPPNNPANNAPKLVLGIRPPMGPRPPLLVAPPAAALTPTTPRAPKLVLAPTAARAPTAALTPTAALAPTAAPAPTAVAPPKLLLGGRVLHLPGEHAKRPEVEAPASSSDGQNNQLGDDASKGDSSSSSSARRWGNYKKDGQGVNSSGSFGGWSASGSKGGWEASRTGWKTDKAESKTNEVDPSGGSSAKDAFEASTNSLGDEEALKVDHVGKRDEPTTNTTTDSKPDASGELNAKSESDKSTPKESVDKTDAAIEDSDDDWGDWDKKPPEKPTEASGGSVAPKSGEQEQNYGAWKTDRRRRGSSDRKSGGKAGGGSTNWKSSGSNDWKSTNADWKDGESVDWKDSTGREAANTDWKSGGSSDWKSAADGGGNDTSEWQGSSGGGGGEKSSRKREYDSKGKEICGDYRRGKCNRGENCRFSHESAEDGGTESGQNSWTRPDYSEPPASEETPAVSTPALPPPPPPPPPPPASTPATEPAPTAPPTPVLVAPPTPVLVAPPTPVLLAPPTPVLVAPPAPVLMAAPTPVLMAASMPAPMAAPMPALVAAPMPVQTPATTPAPRAAPTPALTAAPTPALTAAPTPALMAAQMPALTAAPTPAPRAAPTPALTAPPRPALTPALTLAPTPLAPTRAPLSLLSAKPQITIQGGGQQSAISGSTSLVLGPTQSLQDAAISGSTPLVLGPTQSLQESVMHSLQEPPLQPFRPALWDRSNPADKEIPPEAGGLQLFPKAQPTPKLFVLGALKTLDQLDPRLLLPKPKAPPSISFPVAVVAEAVAAPGAGEKEAPPSISLPAAAVAEAIAAPGAGEKEAPNAEVEAAGSTADEGAAALKPLESSWEAPVAAAAQKPLESSWEAPAAAAAQKPLESSREAPAAAAAQKPLEPSWEAVSAAAPKSPPMLPGKSMKKSRLAQPPLKGSVGRIENAPDAQAKNAPDVQPKPLLLQLGSRPSRPQVHPPQAVIQAGSSSAIGVEESQKAQPTLKGSVSRIANPKDITVKPLSLQLGGRPWRPQITPLPVVAKADSSIAIGVGESQKEAHQAQPPLKGTVGRIEKAPDVQAKPLLLQLGSRPSQSQVPPVQAVTQADTNSAMDVEESQKEELEKLAAPKAQSPLKGIVSRIEKAPDVQAKPVLLQLGSRPSRPQIPLVQAVTQVDSNSATVAEESKKEAQSPLKGIVSRIEKAPEVQAKPLLLQLGSRPSRPQAPPVQAATQVVAENVNAAPDPEADSNSAIGVEESQKKAQSPLKGIVSRIEKAPDVQAKPLLLQLGSRPSRPQVPPVQAATQADSNSATAVEESPKEEPAEAPEPYSAPSVVAAVPAVDAPLTFEEDCMKANEVLDGVEEVLSQIETLAGIKPPPKAPDGGILPVRSRPLKAQAVASSQAVVQDLVDPHGGMRQPLSGDVTPLPSVAAPLAVAEQQDPVEPFGEMSQPFSGADTPVPVRVEKQAPARVRKYRFAGFKTQPQLNQHYIIEEREVVNGRPVFFSEDGTSFMYYLDAADRYQISTKLGRENGRPVDYVTIARYGGTPGFAFQEPETPGYWCEFVPPGEWAEVRIATFTDDGSGVMVPTDEFAAKFAAEEAARATRVVKEDPLNQFLGLGSRSDGAQNRPDQKANASAVQDTIGATTKRLFLPVHLQNQDLPVLSARAKEMWEAQHATPITEMAHLAKTPPSSTAPAANGTSTGSGPAAVAVSAVDTIIEICSIPVKMVGKVIGPKGSQIKAIKDESGAQVTVQKREEIPEGSQVSKITFKGSKDQVEKAKEAVRKITWTLQASDEDASASARPVAPAATPGNSSDSVTEVCTIPAERVGKVIGSRGANLQKIKDESGATVSTQRRHEVPDGARTCKLTFTGTREAVEKAKTAVRQITGTLEATEADPYGTRADQAKSADQAAEDEWGDWDPKPSEKALEASFATAPAAASASAPATAGTKGFVLRLGPRITETKEPPALAAKKENAPAEGQPSAPLEWMASGDDDVAADLPPPPPAIVLETKAPSEEAIAASEEANAATEALIPADNRGDDSSADEAAPTKKGRKTKDESVGEPASRGRKRKDDSVAGSAEPKAKAKAKSKRGRKTEEETGSETKKVEATDDEKADIASSERMEGTKDESVEEKKDDPQAKAKAKGKAKAKAKAADGDAPAESDPKAKAKSKRGKADEDKDEKASKKKKLVEDAKQEKEMMKAWKALDK